jgi:hypothetical protein
MEKCNCFAVKFQVVSKDKQSYKPCNTFDKNDCVDAILKSMTDDTETKKSCLRDCPLECEEISYEHTISTVEFPSKIYAKFIKKKFLSSFFEASELNFETIREHTLALDINYDELKYTTITESPYKTFSALVADIGGTCSIFLGLNLLGFVRIFEFFSDLIVLYCNRNRNSSNNDNKAS